MNNNRRQFLRNAALLSLAYPMIGSSCKNEKAASSAQDATAAIKKFTTDKFGIQLWTVKDDMAKDPRATLKALSDFGYNQIESFQGDKGVFWGMTAKEYDEYIQSLGMDLYASHCNPQYALDPKLRDEFKKLVDDSASVGMKYLINPYMGFLKKKEDFKKATQGFNELGEICKASGLKYAYHNHHYSFQKLEDEYMQDIMMTGTNPDLVEFEMDLYWVVTAGQDPVEWLKKYPGRFTLGHVKDRHKAEKVAEIEKVEKADPNFGLNVSCVLGTGAINFDEVLLTAGEQGMKYFIVEQERYDNSTPLVDVGKDATFMKKYKA